MNRRPRRSATALPGDPLPPRSSCVLLPVLLAAILSALPAARSFAAEAKSFKVGFDIRNTQYEDGRQYQPFLAYLGRATGFRFELRFTRKNENIVDLLGTGKVDFAFMGAQSYLAARQRYGAIPLVRGLNRDGKAEYRSAIVVKSGSKVGKVGDLRGRRFAFGSAMSTQGHLIPLIVFAEHGLTLRDLSGHAFTGSHRNCALAVLRGEFDAGGMQDTLAEEYAREGLLRIVHMSRYYPSSGVAVRDKVPGDVLAQVRRAFLEFRPKGRDGAGLYHWDRTEMPNGFVEAKDSDYEELRKYALRFGLLRRDGR